MHQEKIETLTEKQKTIFEKLQPIIAQQLGVEQKQVNLGATFAEDLGADSLDMVELVMAIEEGFCIDIPDEDVKSISIVEDAVKYIQDFIN
uniref:Acyl carrier protein n=1 Tax=Dicranema revolutum TaxID=239144 RepID=A0A4D6WRK0_9FLOR|nr:Acyl carrier protein [Dicranema revolutum]